MTLRKYNPSFLSDSELIDGFCVRQVEFQLLVETLRETEGASNVHRIVIGPRGSGKTTLLLRVVIEVRRDLELSRKFIALVLPEERYEVTTVGEFWLECLGHLAHQVSDPEASADFRQYYENLRRIRSDRDLNDLCVQALVDFAAEQGKRLLIVAENLNSMFDDVSDPDCGWRLRETLQTEPRIMLFGSATARFDEIDHPEHALYGFFDVMMLRRLNTEKCATLWAKVSGREPKDRNIRPIEILTGGNPRLVAIAARFGSTFSFRALIDELLDLVDDHTEYFRSHLESLPPRERRVYLALAELWRPATCRDIAELARLSTSHCSAHIRRLIGRGTVQEAGGTLRRKEYYLTERMYNIYYLLRKRGGPSETVQALIRFMASYYAAPERIQMGTRSASWIRAESRCRQSDVPGYESDIRAALEYVPKDDAQLQKVIRRLIVHAVWIGSDRLLQLLEGSPSATVLSPLAAALQLDLGAVPRVSREVIEVARDVQDELKQMRLDVKGAEAVAAQSVPKPVTEGS